MAQEKTYYAIVQWAPEDVQTLRPKWSIEKCTAWLEANEQHIQDRLVELGYGVMDELLPGS